MTKDDCFAFLGIYINKSTNLFSAEIDTLYNVFEGKTIVDVCISLLKKYATDVQIGVCFDWCWWLSPLALLFALYLWIHELFGSWRSVRCMLFLV